MNLRVSVVFPLALTSLAVYGQTTDGHVTGTVFDKSGAGIPEAAIELENVQTGVKRMTSTGGAGGYRIENVPVGIYSVTARAERFAPARLDNVRVLLNRTTTANLSLDVAAFKAGIQVTESGAPLDAATATIGSSFGSREAIYSPASALPMGVYNLALSGAGVASSGGVGLGEGPSVGGQRPRQNNFTIEGVDNTRKDVTGATLRVSNEAVAEFSSLQNQYSAEFGHSTGGQFNIALRSGANESHGSVYEYFQNRHLNAVDEAHARQGKREKSRFDNNRFGASVGGPMVRNKLFYFANIEAGILGELAAPESPTLTPTAEGYEMLAAMPELSRANLDVLRTYADPAPAATTTTTVLDQEIPIGVLPITSPDYLNLYSLTGSVDYDIGARDRLRFRTIASWGDGRGASNLPVFSVEGTGAAGLVSLSEFHNFSPALSNELRLAYSRIAGEGSAGDFQFPGLDAFPNIVIEQDLNLQLGPPPGAPDLGTQNTYQLVNNTTWITGGHTWKFGVDSRRYISPWLWVSDLRGNYRYDYLERYLLDLQPEARRSSGKTTYWGNSWHFYWFVQDQWRIGRNLTLSLGLRHEYKGIPAGDKDQKLNAVSSVPGLLEFDEPRAQWSNFAPRLGLAWSPGKSGDTVVRAGFGMGYDVYPDNFGVLSQPPQQQVSISLPASDTAGFLANGGIPQNLPPPNLTPEQWRASTSSFIYDQHLPYSLQWTAGAERVFAKDYSFNVRYLGTRGVRLFTQSLINLRPVVTPERSLPTYLERPSQSELDALPLNLGELVSAAFMGDFYVPEFLRAGFTNPIFAFPNRGSSTYHGLATELTRRFARGLMCKAAFTWSHNVDDSTADLFSTLLSPRRPQDSRDMRPERASSFLDRRYRFSFKWIHEAPWLNNHPSWVIRNLLGNWIISGSYIAESAQLATVQSGLDSNMNMDGDSDRVLVNPAGKDGTGSDIEPLLNSNGQVVGYLAMKPAARYIKAGIGVYPTGGRNTLPMRGINNWDISVTRRIRLSEGVALEFRALFYNAFNHPQYIPGSTNTVQAVASTDTRNHLIPGNELFNDPTRIFSSHPRRTQLVVRITF